MGEDASLDDFLDDQEADEPDEMDASDGPSPGGDAGEADAAESESADADATDPTVVDDTAGETAAPRGDNQSSVDDDGNTATGTAPADGDDRVPPDAVDPATTTAAWSPGGAACAACGSVVERRWRDEQGLVCPDCKDW